MWADLQDTGVQSSGALASGGTLSLAFASNVTAGNLIVVTLSCFRSGGGVVITSVGDTLGNTYHSAGTLQQAAAGEACQIWYAYNVAGGACTVNVVAGTVEYISLGIGEKSGCPVTDPLNQHTSADCGGVNSSSASSGSITTSTTGDLYVGVLNHNDGAISITPTGGFTDRYTNTSSTNEPISYSDLGCGVSQAAGTYAATYTLGANAPWSAAIASFKTAAAANTPWDTPHTPQHQSVLAQ